MVFFGFFDQKKVVCLFVLVFCQFIGNHCVCRHRTTLQIGNTHEHPCGVRHVALLCASGVIVVVSWALHSVSGVPIGALLVVLQQWLVVASVCRTFLVG